MKKNALFKKLLILLTPLGVFGMAASCSSGLSYGYGSSLSAKENQLNEDVKVTSDKTIKESLSDSEGPKEGEGNPPATNPENPTPKPDEQPTPAPEKSNLKSFSGIISLIPSTPAPKKTADNSIPNFSAAYFPGFGAIPSNFDKVKAEIEKKEKEQKELGDPNSVAGFDHLFPQLPWSSFNFDDFDATSTTSEKQ
ncbi:hypothetical protein NPA08_02030 [Mycoplasmopsis citelli]|uniref:Lipoprotein n=1 Tax=Mycoplasmopsis citelli TaxID=171281 RepID=A0A449B0W0_9BACT|nr:hypothetical protein [Mycoplasmopsis citelli]UUD36585.1 hypothetical protein NPA08_02030 [Mycoplasmopsis citelli]VEU74222.1 Uncharacterised protein [Mycoplasmopsis citelli]